MNLKTLTIAMCLLGCASLSVRAQAITISAQPQSKTVKLGTSVTFSVTASTTNAGPLTYQWKKDGTDVPGTATNASYTIAKVASGDAGSYTVVVDDGKTNAITSSAAVLTIAVIPAITTQPVSTNVAVGASAVLTVTANGTSPSYYWKRGTALQSSTSNTCPVLTTAAGSADYTVIVSNIAGSVTSTKATVKVVGIPGFTQQPASTNVAAGTNYTIKTTCTNDLGSYFWYFNATNALASTTNTYKLNYVDATNAGSYTLVLSNIAGSVTSSPAVLTVLAKPAITGHPTANNTNAIGSSVTLSVTATGDSLKYQWLKDTKVIAAQTNSSLALTNLAAAAAGKYSVIVSNAVGKATSSNATVYVFGPPTISTQPKSQKLLSQQDLKLSVVATGTKPFTNLTYQWKLEGTNVPGKTDKELSITDATSTWAGRYTVVVSNFGGMVTSAVATVTFAADTNAPVLKFVNAPTKAVTTNFFTLRGTATDNVAVTNVAFQMNSAGSFTNVVSTNTWATWSADLGLVVGSNTIAVVAKDMNGNNATNIARIFYAPYYNLVVTTNGTGKGTLTGYTNKVQYNGVYKLTAKADSKNLFMGWSSISGVKTNSDASATALTFLVTNNVALTVTFDTNRFYDLAGEYNGLFSQTNGVTHDTAGALKLTITTNLAYSGKVQMGGINYPVTGQLDSTGADSVTVKTGVTMAFGMDSLQLTGTVYSASWTSVLSADLNVFNKQKLATNFSGTYTFVIPPYTNGPATNGYGYGSLTVSTNGTVTLVGAAADGTVLSQTAPVSRNGDFPLYVPLYALSKTNTGGELMGWITFPTNDVPTGNVCWIKTSAVTNSAIYRTGLTNQAEIISSRFTAPTSSQPKVLQNFVFGISSFIGGNLTNRIDNWVFMGQNGAVYAYDGTTSIKFSSSGVFSGKLVHPVTKKAVAFAGMALQNSTNAFGYFIGTNVTGTVQIDAYDLP